MSDIGKIVRAFRSRPSVVYALATLVRATGSSYRRSGARMFVSADGRTAGCLSAGCLEEEVAAAAQEVIESGASRLMLFDTRRRFGCNGALEIFVEPVSRAFLSRLVLRTGARKVSVIATVFEGDASTLGTKFIDDDSFAVPGSFVQQIAPTVSLLVVGTGPDGVALAAQAQLLGWETTVVESIADWRTEADPWTVAVVATHNYGRDCAALRHLLPIGLRYVGLIGPRRRRDELLSDVLDAGATLASKLFAPAGLHLGADSPGEIALSVAAEIQTVMTNATALSLRDRRAPIHAESGIAEAPVALTA